MSGITSVLGYLLMASGAASAVLVVLVIYEYALDIRETEEIYLNKTQERMMASDQPVLISKMNHLAQVIIGVAVAAVVPLVASEGVWVWIGLHRS